MHTGQLLCPSESLFAGCKARGELVPKQMVAEKIFMSAYYPEILLCCKCTWSDFDKSLGTLIR